jgi:serine/threonine protein kinase
MLDAGSGRKEVRDLGSLPPQPGDVIADKYVIENVVGTGGMGVVVAARHLQLGQQVAIKLLRLSGLEPDRQAEARARFLREGQAVAALSSDHVVRIHDVGTLESGEPFMVMELLRGEDLARLLDRHGPAPVPVAVDYLLQVCHAVAEAHAAGIVHRDLKPSNLFVSMKSDGRPIVKVLDFGISKTASAAQEAFEGNLTDTRSVVGSPFYMSPEQVRDAKRVDARTDVWSLGMILYEMLTGEPAFKASTLPAICAAIAADTPRPLREARPEVPSELEAVVARCLEKDPERRYQKVSDLVRALSPFAPGPDGSKSAEYASRQDVMALSEPFAIPAPDAATHHFQTMQSAPPPDHSSHPPAGPSASPPAPGGWLPATPMGSGTRRKQEGDGSSTLVSSSGNQESPPAPAGPSAREKSAAPRVSRGAAASAAALGVLVAIGAFWFVVSRATVVTDTGRTTQFTLNVDSRPSGASVLEGTRLLGTTPYSVSLSRESLQQSPRRLTLTLDGYERYSIEQGTSDHDVRVLALLTKTPAPQAPAASAPAAPSNEPAPGPSGTVPHARATSHSVAPTTATKPSASTDIRLER